MKKEDAQKWIDALRSGEYKQCANSLKDSYGGFCCLGVLDEINPEMKLSGGSKGTLKNYYRIGLSSDLGRVVFRYPVLINGHPDSIEESVTLSSLNDAYGFTFDEIADVIQMEYVLDLGLDEEIEK